MADSSGTINHTSRGTNLSCGTVTLNFGETLTISIGTGFPAAPVTTEITKVEFYDILHGQKGSNLLGKWVRDSNPPYTVPEGVAVAAFGTGVQLSDSDDGTNDVDYYYNVTATDSNGNTYTADPELILKKKRQTGGAERDTPVSPDA